MPRPRRRAPLGRHPRHGAGGHSSPEALAIKLEEAAFSWQETLGVPPASDADAIRSAMTQLALIYHPDVGGSQEQMTRIYAAYETASTSPEER